MHRTVDEQEGQHEDREHHVVQGCVAREVDQAEELAARHALQPVLASGEIGLQEEEVKHLGERERDHREVDAAAADRQGAHHESERGAADQPDQQADLRRHTPELEHMACRVGGTAEERGVAERQQAGEPDQQVEGTREERETHHLHHEDRVRADQWKDGDQRQQRQVDHELLRLPHAISPCRTVRRAGSAGRSP
jgi:hypothetical protein